MNGVGYGITPFMGASGILARSSGGGGGAFVNEYSMSFDGVDEYFTGASTFSELNGLKSFSISLWYKNPDNTRLASLFSIGRDTTSSNFQSFLGCDNVGRLRYFAESSARYTSSNAGVITNNTWHHILLAVDLSQSTSAQRARIFVDGVDQTSGTTNQTDTAFFNSTTPIYIGEDVNSFWNPTLGNIDEFAMWVGTDQRANVSDIYNGGVPFDLSTLATAPDHWWRMGDNDTWSGSQWTLTDNIGSYDLTSANMEEADRLPISPNSYTQNSFSFDGVDEYVAISANSNLQISDTFTISHWIKFTSTSQMYVTNFANKYGTFVQNGYAYLVFRNLSNTQIGLQSTSTINDGNWHNIIVIKTTSTMTIYIDGVLNANNSNGATGITSTSSNAIGALFTGAIPFQGTIDEVAIWNNDQSANISTIFNNGVPQDISSLSPLSHWRMGENATWNGSIWTLTDQGSGGNNATSVNMEEADKTGDQAYVL